VLDPDIRRCFPVRSCSEDQNCDDTHEDQAITRSTLRTMRGGAVAVAMQITLPAHPRRSPTIAVVGRCA
jgi:hypothetical protein